MTNLQTTQPPVSDSGALTTRVNRIIIGPPIFEDSPAHFLPGPNLSLQKGQCQSPSGAHCRSKQTARSHKGQREREREREESDRHWPQVGYMELHQSINLLFKSRISYLTL